MGTRQILSHPQSSTAAITLGTLQAVLARGQRAHPALAARLDKAAHLLACRTIEPSGPDAQSWWVQSETNPATSYFVIVQLGPWPCTCRDFEQRRDWCKHGLAVALLRRCTELAAPLVDEAAPIPFVLTPLAVAVLDQEPTPAV